jgi:hypothetical protein
MLGEIDAVIPDEDQELLETDLSLVEFSESMRVQQIQSALGPDGIPAEFYMMLWEILSPMLLKVANEGISKKRFSPWILTAQKSKNT